MKIPLYQVFIITLLIVGSSTVVEGSGIDNKEKKKISESLNPSEIKNLTQNEDDSVYPQISSSSNSVYVVWQESVGNYASKNYDIFFMKSNDEGDTFGDPVNLSNNPGFSEHPQIAAVGDNIYIAWVDDSSGERKIMFCKSPDSGMTFSENIVVAQNTIGPHHAELAAKGKNVYIIWNGFDTEINNKVLFSKSDDEGETFRELREIGKADAETYPKIAANADGYYITWDKKKDKDTEILFIKGQEYNNGYSDTNPRRLNTQGIGGGESQVAAFADHALVSWTSNLPVDKKYVYIKSSGNNGNDFGNTIIISSINSSNVENMIINDTIYISWQDNINGNQDIYLSTSKINEISEDMPVNVSDNTGVSECPSITVSRNGIHMVWEDNTTGNHEVLYKRLT
jgi:hypothetical protein